MSLQNIYYSLPEAGYLLFLLFPIAALLWMIYRYRERTRNVFASPEILPALLTARPNSAYIGKSLALCLAWVCAVVALMQPISYGHYPEELARPAGAGLVSGKQREAHDIILLIDASASMTIADMRSKQSRLEFAKQVASAIVNRFDGQRVAVEAFTTEVTPLSPLTTSYFFAYSMIKQIQANEGGAPGTDLLKALQEIHRKYFAIPSNVQKTLILLTDGEDTGLEYTQSSEQQKRLKEMLDQVEDAAKNHFRVTTIGIGTKQGGSVPGITYKGESVVSRLNEELLQELSQRGSGHYYFANSFAPINLAEEIVAKIKNEENELGSKSQTSSTASGKQDNLIHYQYFQIPLGAALFLLVLILLIPNTSKRKNHHIGSFISSWLCVFLLGYGGLEGAETVDEAQQMHLAADYFHVKKYAEARDIYQSLLQKNLPPWKRSVLMYNMGCALLGEKKWDQANKAFGAIAVDNELKPLLDFRIKRNIMLGHVRQAESLLADKSGGPQAVALLKMALQEEVPAQQVFCGLESAEGKKPCEKSQEIERIAAIARKDLENIKLPPTASETTPEQKESPAQEQRRSNQENQQKSNQVLQQLLEMEKADEAPLTPQPVKKKVDRPW